MTSRFQWTIGITLTTWLTVILTLWIKPSVLI